MTLYDPKKQSLIVNGINITHWGESMVDRNYGGNYVEGRKGMQGDASTNALYNQMETFTITLWQFVSFPLHRPSALWAI